MTRLLREEDGQGAVEYAVLASMVSIAAIILVATLGHQVRDLFQAVLDVFA